MSELQAGLQCPLDQREDIQGFHLQCSVFEGNLVRVHQATLLKQVKELEAACAQYRHIDPFTMAILENLATDALPPNDWKHLARACLSGGDN